MATFASNVHRVQQIVNSAGKIWKKSCCMWQKHRVNMIDTARELGYIKCPDNLFI